VSQDWPGVRQRRRDRRAQRWERQFNRWRADELRFDGRRFRARQVRGSGMFLPILVAAIQLVGTHAASRGAGVPEIGIALLLLGPFGLLLRRSQPLLAYAITLVAGVGYLVFDLPRGPFFLATFIGLFSAARRVPAQWIWCLTGAAYAAYVGATVVGGNVDGIPRSQPSLAGYVIVAIIGTVAVMLAEANRIRSEHFAEMARSAAAAAEARREQSRRQASDERLRIARELHDVLGHHLSLINVRAGVALHLLESRPQEVREALNAIKFASAEALQEVRSVLATLNPEKEQAPRAPTHGLADLDRLAEETRAAGTAVRVAREGAARTVPAPVDRAAYRIVQEALTNVRRHAGPDATASVTVRYDPDLLTLRIEDTGAGSAASTVDTGGNGIPGMRERATALGGTLRAGPGAEGGFAVIATLPTTTTERET
jgi:signal transduction histidine kinase